MAIVVAVSAAAGTNNLAPGPSATNATGTSTNPVHRSNADASNLPTLEVDQALMVTVELDFGGKPPSIAQGLGEIERRYAPDDGQGRTFAIIEAYGEPTTNGLLHISIHVSAEKPGIATMIFRRTGEVLWRNRIVPATGHPTSSFAGNNLFIMIGDAQGKPFMVDGSKGAASILDAKLRDSNVTVRDFWPDGTEREATFFYSACGCPVKVTAVRVGDKTARTRELPVIFPDDPQAVKAISRLMGWE